MAERDPYVDALQPLSGSEVRDLGALGVLLACLGTALACLGDANDPGPWSWAGLLGALGCYLGAASCGLRIGRGR